MSEAKKFIRESAFVLPRIASSSFASRIMVAVHFGGTKAVEKGGESNQRPSGAIAVFSVDYIPLA